MNLIIYCIFEFITIANIVNYDKLYNLITIILCNHSCLSVREWYLIYDDLWSDKLVNAPRKPGVLSYFDIFNNKYLIQFYPRRHSDEGNFKSEMTLHVNNSDIPCLVCGWFCRSLISIVIQVETRNLAKV